jgi:hypothetical protein
VELAVQDLQYGTYSEELAVQDLQYGTYSEELAVWNLQHGNYSTQMTPIYAENLKTSQLSTLPSPPTP